MRYCKEYLVAVNTGESIKNAELGLDAPERIEWRKIYLDFAHVLSFYEYVDSPSQIIVEYSTNKGLHLNVEYEVFKRDFQEYVKQANKPQWMTS